jgi:hypothetical protein
MASRSPARLRRGHGKHERKSDEATASGAPEYGSHGERRAGVWRGHDERRAGVWRGHDDERTRAACEACASIRRSGAACEIFAILTTKATGHSKMSTIH